MPDRPLIAVLRGGYSGESVISHQSAKRMVEALDKERYAVCIITVERDAWTAQDAEGAPIALNRGRLLIGKEERKVDAALIAIHGTPGEDGRLQGFLDMLDIPYQTGGVLNMALTFSKFSTTALLRQLGFPVAKSELLLADDPASRARIVEHIGFPCFVKPDQSGSSLGVTKVKHADALGEALTAAFRESQLVMVEAAVTGAELTCGVLRIDGKVVALPICEIRTPREFFDYEAKYHATDTEEIVPAPLPDDVTRLVQQRSVDIYSALNCNGMVRVDHFWTGSELLTIEVNTTPGFSAASIFPKMLQASGLGIDPVINGLVKDMVGR